MHRHCATDCHLPLFYPGLNLVTKKLSIWYAKMNGKKTTDFMLIMKHMIIAVYVEW